MILRKLRIGTRLALGFGAILLLMMAVVVGGTLLTKQSRDTLAGVLRDASAKESLAAAMKAISLEQSVRIRNVGLQSEIKAMQVDEDQARKLGKSYHEMVERMEKLNLSPSERQFLESLVALERQIDEPLRQALGMSTSFRAEEAAKIIVGELDPITQKMQSNLDQLIGLQKTANREAIQEAVIAGDRLALWIYGVELAVLIAAVFVAWGITRSITRPLAFSVGIAQRVAAGDLTSRIRSEGRDEAAQLLVALRGMNEGLARMVLQIRQGAESIAVGAGQVAAGNQSLSSRTEEHASSIEETASTLEEFTTTVKQNAEHAKQASALAATASVTAQKGGEVVGKVVTTMQEVSESSRRISDIIAVIDGISFQTNILALNAAVEAARAGEQGRGFAVVASEVRSLAQRSAASAKEIRGLIESSVGRVEAGAKLVEQAGKTMDELVGNVKRVAEIMTEIASASHEQSSGIEQINKAITQMDTVVQMNASLVEEATAAATSMAHQATALARSVAQFRIEEQGAAPAAATPAIAEPVPGLRHAAAQVAPQASAVPARREPVLAATDADEWKEF